MLRATGGVLAAGELAVIGGAKAAGDAATGLETGAPGHHNSSHVVVEEDRPEKVALLDADVGGELGRLAFVLQLSFDVPEKQL